MPILLKLFKKKKKTDEKGRLPNPLYEASIILILKPQKDTTKRETDGPVSLKNMDAKILYHMFANSVQQYIKRITDHDQVVFVSEMQRGISVHK